MWSPSSRYLLISRVGTKSLHAAWLSPASDRGFDVLLSAFESAVVDPAESGVFFEHRPGTKVAGYGAIFDDHAGLISKYDYVALFDDDLLISARELQRLFAIVTAHQLKIAQPALTYDSYFTYAALLQDPAYRLRYVNYVEMMCPVFRSDVLQIIKPLYALGYESGIDLIWCNAVSTSPQDFAVIDEIAVQHTRPVGTLKSANGFTGPKRYEDDIYAILAKFGLPWLSCVPFAGIRLDGKIVKHRSGFFWTALAGSFAIWRRRGSRQRARSILVYWKHLLSRKAVNIPVTIAPREC
jgi:hypothetical protein